MVSIMRFYYYKVCLELRKLAKISFPSIANYLFQLLF